MPRAKTEQAEQFFDAESELHAYDETYLECRDLRHPWVVVGYYRQNGEVRRKLQCARCPTVRTDVWTRNGTRINSSYEYPDDYQFTGSGQSVRGDEVRREVLRRTKVYASHATLTQAARR